MERSFLLTIAMVFCQAAFGQSVPSLINYQGRLTGPNGAPLPMANYGIQFRLWDSPTNQTGLIWGQQQNVSVQSNGVFNVILGALGGGPITNSIPAVNDLAFAFGVSSRYLSLTIVSSNGIAIAAPSEIAPRQQLLSVPFAVSAASAGVAASVIAGGITSASLAPGSVTSNHLADGNVVFQKLAARVLGADAGAGGVALSPPVQYFQTTVSANPVSVPGLSVTLNSSGRPTWVILVPDLQTTDASAIISSASGSDVGIEIFLYRNAGIVARCQLFVYASGTNPHAHAPPSVAQFLDFAPPSGTNNYSIAIKANDSLDTVAVQAVRLVAFEF